jgi:MFS superfamily sulfate permease-like transporter
VPHLLGISGASDNFFQKLWHILQHLPDVSLAPALTGILSLAAMLLLRDLAPRISAALVVIAVATIVIGLLGGEATGVHVTGHIPSGLPHLVVPDLDAKTLTELAPGALAIVLVGYAEALGAAKAAATQSGGKIDPNQGLVAHGPANILSGLFGGFLVVGSPSKTSVVTASGARSQLANLVAAAFCFFTLVFLTPLFRNMPQPALAAICHCRNVASDETELPARAIRTKPLVVCKMCDCHPRRTAVDVRHLAAGRDRGPEG